MRWRPFLLVGFSWVVVFVSLGAAQDSQSPPSPAALAKKLLAAETEAAALTAALDLVGHPDQSGVRARVPRLLAQAGPRAARALLQALRERRLAWPETVDPVLALLGDGRPELEQAAEELVAAVWLAPQKPEAEACLKRVRARLQPAGTAPAVLRGAVRVAEMHRDLAWVRPLIALLEAPLDRVTRVRAARALEAITLDPRFGLDGAAWRRWAETHLQPGLTREALLERNIRSVYRETARVLVAALEASITGLGEPEVERLKPYFASPYPEVAAAASRQVADLYLAVTELPARRRIQKKVLPLLLPLLGSHHDGVVLATVGALERLSRPPLGDAALAGRVRAALLELAEEGGAALAEPALRALAAYADPRDGETGRRLMARVETLGAAPPALRAALLRALGAFRAEGASAVFARVASDPREAEEVRVAAAAELLAQAGERAVAPLARLLQQLKEPPGLRRRLAALLGDQVSRLPAVVQPLADRLRADPDAEVRRIAAESLAYVGEGPGRAQAAQALHAVLREGDGPRLMAAVMRSLGRLGYRAALPELVRFAREKEPLLRDTAQEALVGLVLADPARASEAARALLGAGLPQLAVTALERLRGDAKRWQAAAAGGKGAQATLELLYVRALAAAGDPASLRKARGEVEKLRQRRPQDPAVALLEVRVLHLLGETALLLQAVKRNRPLIQEARALQELQLLEAWGTLRAGKAAEAASLFAAAFQRATLAPEDPLYWEYAVGHALALARADGAQHRAEVERLLTSLPPAFAEKAPAWLQAARKKVESLRLRGDGRPR